MPQKTITGAKGDSALLDKPKEILKPDYSDDELKYLGALQKKLEIARDLRDTNHDEFDGMTFIENWQAEEKSANTFITPKLNSQDSNFQSGIVRDSLFQLISQIVNLDLSPLIHGYGTGNLEVTALGQAFETIMDKCNTLENDNEKKVFRAFELFKHGYVFVEEIWEERWIWGKKWIKKFEGHIKSASWKKAIKRVFAHPVRNILSGLNVYLGDITQYYLDYQPFIFTVKYRHYEDAASEYGAEDEDGKTIWDRWEFVTKTKQEYASPIGSQLIYNTWRLTSVVNNMVEEIHFQDKWNNEYAILLNGVLMTPIGMPLPWGYEDYNIVQQNLKPIHPFWAYGMSFVKEMKANAAIYDEMLKMAVLKTQKSFAPPRFNMSGQVISRRAFMPGKITNGINPQQIPTLDAHEISGVTNSEMEMIKKIEENIHEKNMSPKPPPGKVTQGMVMMAQQQAKVAIGLFIFYVSLMEQKLSWLRLFNLLEHWFDPIDERFDKAKGEIKKNYNIVTQDINIPGQGRGKRMVVPFKRSEIDVNPKMIQDNEKQLQDKYKMPYQIIALEPDEIKNAKIMWEITVDQKEKKTSDNSKIMFRGFVSDLMSLSQSFGLKPDPQQLGEEFALVWDRDPSKLFQKGDQGQGNPAEQGGSPAADNPGQGAPQKKIPGLPSPEKNFNKVLGGTVG